MSFKINKLFLVDSSLDHLESQKPVTLQPKLLSSTSWPPWQKLDMMSSWKSDQCNKSIGESPEQFGILPPNLFKINFDGVIFEEFDQTGIGVVIRNSNGSVITSMSQPIHQVLSAVKIEAAAAARALEFATEVGINQAILEGDSALVIKALADEGPSLAVFGNDIQDARIFANSFTCLNFSHTRRDGNNSAHNLAKHSLNVPDLTMWMGDVPLQLLDVTPQTHTKDLDAQLVL